MRELQYDEFCRMIEKAVRYEFGTFHRGEGLNEDQAIYNYRNICWFNKVQAVTTDGHDMIFTTLTPAGNEYLESLWVDPEYRRQGRGKALLVEAMKNARNGLSLHVNRDNHTARHLYYRNGLLKYGADRKGTEIFMATCEGLGGREIWQD